MCIKLSLRCDDTENCRFKSDEDLEMCENVSHSMKLLNEISMSIFAGEEQRTLARNNNYQYSIWSYVDCLSDSIYGELYEKAYAGSQDHQSKQN